MAKEKFHIVDVKIPTESALYALERTDDFLRGDYNAGVAVCDPVADLFASLFETLVRDVRENDAIDEADRSAFEQNLKKALAEYFS